MYTRIVHRKYRYRKFMAILLYLSVILFISWSLYRHYEPLFFVKTDYKYIIEDAAKRHNIDPLLLKAIIWQESRFRPGIVGRNNEIGLMQIRPEYGAVTEWVKKNKVKTPCKGMLFDPELNIEIGSWYIARALKRWTGYKYQYELALSEYNAGLKGMSPWIPENQDGKVIEHITIPSTREYIKGVLAKYHEYAAKRKAE